MRCFLAIDLPEEIKDKIEGIKRDFKIKGIKLVEKENLHITIKLLGEIDEETVEKIKNLDLSINPIKVKIKNIGIFPNENYIRVIWLGATNLVDLFKEIDEKLSDIGFKKEREYVPHVTIGRVKFIENKKALKDKIEKHRKIDIGEFEVRSIKLMKSTLTPNGPIYEVIKEW